MRRPTRARASPPTPESASSRLALCGTALLILAVVIVSVACSGRDNPDQRQTPPPTEPGANPSTGNDEAPDRDLIDLARRYEGRIGLPLTVDLPEPDLGDIQQFDVLMLPADAEAEPTFRTASAVLRAVSRHAYFFVEEGQDVEQADLDAAVSSFEDQIWPVVTGAFALPPTPGVDGDPRIAILHADLGAAVGGYISDIDSYPTEVLPHSNQREIVYMNLRGVPPGSSSYASVLAHELQHLSHLRLDPDEETWVNEGLSEFAARLVTGGGRSFGAFLNSPDTQLNAWDDLGGSARHYQASSLFFAYLMEQTGGDVGALAAEPGNSVDGIRAFLADLAYPRSFAQIVADWAAANFVDAPEGPYGYRDLRVIPPIPEQTSTAAGEEVHQFAADYLEVQADDFPGEPAFEFDGADRVPVLAAQAGADGQFWWSGRADSMDATLTRELDLTGVEEATLTFRTWFDIERWFDYAYVAASRDGGETWEALPGLQTTTDDPLEVAYGPGYSGATEGWVDERIDLSAYAGSAIQLRFEYVTDSALQRPGWAIDDIAVPEIGFFDDAEADAGGWHRAGFRRLADDLDQTFELRLITSESSPNVRSVPLDSDNRARVPLTGLGTAYERAVIVIVATTDGTTESAGFRYEIVDTNHIR